MAISHQRIRRIRCFVVHQLVRFDLLEHRFDGQGPADYLARPLWLAQWVPDAGFWRFLIFSIYSRFYCFLLAVSVFFFTLLGDECTQLTQLILRFVFDEDITQTIKAILLPRRIVLLLISYLRSLIRKLTLTTIIRSIILTAFLHLYQIQFELLLLWP